MASWTRQYDGPVYETVELVISAIIPYCLIVIGTIGNLISVVILLNPENRRASTNIYLIFLCLMDTISLYQWNLSNSFYSLTNGQQQIWGNSLIMCKLSQFFAFYTLHTSAMFLTFVELDRACLLRSKWYKRRIARVPVALMICTIILVSLFALDGFLFELGFSYPTYDNSTGTYETAVGCFYTLNTVLNDFYSIQFPWIHLVVMYFVPFSVIIACTLGTAKKLLINRSLANEQLSRSSQRNRRISIMLLLMCLTYIISTLPNRLCFSVFADMIMGHNYTDTVFLSTNTLMYTRNALNIFFLYMSVSGFRRDIRHIILRCFGRQVNQVLPTGHTMTRDHIGTITAIQDHIRTTVS
ncbi:unnamed protein product [Adineta steineri]|uniref:G-protein coupled receptors family 1 profile domain-containing protein n=1 Tax=Adineta steineri TaxID=433720 RepID=A0A815DZJ1_9BILA|nr:unnamed protein product [Adineta steineri]CAF1321415.1 unnamed protein product [Adineta steineri]CAF3603443.1 unnamed protein product [Adineta steineri]CAF3645359.1 unnamed protein product [Adineta steineri]